MPRTALIRQQQAEKRKRRKDAKPKSNLRSLQVAARKAKFLTFLESVSGHVGQAVALFNECGDRMWSGQPYEWARMDPEFAEKMADAKNRVPAKIKTIATQAIVKGMKNGDAAFTKLGLQYAKALEPEQQVNVQVNTFSLADALAGKIPTASAKQPENAGLIPDEPADGKAYGFGRIFNDAEEEV